MVQWPNGEKTALSVYDNNEKGQSGYYPVGISNMWHSGIHINTEANTPIYPLLDGKLVAYRIEEEYKSVALPKSITAKMFDALGSEKQGYYSPRSKEKTVYDINENSKDKKDLYSNNFVLMFHEIMLGNSATEKIEFYTLYMNLTPRSFYTLKSDNDNYERVGKNTLVMPFYIDKKYKIKDPATIPALRYEGSKNNTYVICIEVKNSFYAIECSTGLEVYRDGGVGECIGTTNKLVRSCFIGQLNGTDFIAIRIGSDDITYVPIKISNDYELLEEVETTQNKLKIRKKNTTAQTETNAGDSTVEIEDVITLVQVHHDGTYKIYKCIEESNIGVVATIVSADGKNIDIYNNDTFKYDLGTQTLETYIQQTTKIRSVKIKRNTENKIAVYPPLFEKMTKEEPYVIFKKYLEAETVFSTLEYLEIYYKKDEFPEVLTIVTSDGEKGFVYVDTVKNTLLRNIGTIQKNIKDKELATRDCIGYAAKGLHGKHYYDLVVILEKELPGVAESLNFTFFDDKIYKDSTPTVEMTEKEKEEYAKLAESGIVSRIIENKNNDNLDHLRIDNSEFYYKRNKDNSKQWGSFFQKATAGLFESEEDIFCRGGNIIRNLSVEEGVLEQLKNLFVGNYLSKDKIEMIYGKDTNLSDYEKVRRALRRFMSNHPLEWDKQIYDEKPIIMNDFDFQRLKEIAEATDIWNTALADVLGSENLFWFVHPIYFVNHLQREGYLSFNPYGGKVLDIRVATKNDYKSVTVKSCPGFAPVKHNSERTTDWIKGKYPLDLQEPTNLEYYWSEIGYIAGYSWAYGDGKEFKFHKGIDLRGEEGDDIISMITGEVWAVILDAGSLGNVLIVKDLIKDSLYLLAHLSKYNKKEGNIVYPGQTVAYVGSTGLSSGPHLHLEVYKYAGSKTGIFINGQSKVGSLEDLRESGKRLNPLDHSEYI